MEQNSDKIKSIILDEPYQIGFMPVAAGVGDIFAHRASRVFWLVVRNTHRVSSQFAHDVRAIGKAFRKQKPKNVRAFEQLLLDNAVDPAAMHPFRPKRESLTIITDSPEGDELQAKILKEQMDVYYSNLEELRLAMLGKGKPVTYKIQMKVEN